jgi:tetratricopeptide (TPR) repeat protein
MAWSEGFKLLARRQYAKAAALFTREIDDHPESQHFLGRGDAFVGLGQYAQALEDYRTATEYRHRERGGCLDDLGPISIGATLWLMDREKEAAATWHEGVKALLDGKTTYADAAGGVTTGLLLWFASFRGELDEFRNDALRLLKDRARARRIESWPGPIALFALGRLSERALLDAAVSRPSFTQYIQPDTLKRGDDKNVSQASFYLAASAIQSDQPRARERLQTCISRGDDIRPFPEFYLARHELLRLGSAT